MPSLKHAALCSYQHTSLQQCSRSFQATKGPNSCNVCPWYNTGNWFRGRSGAQESNTLMTNSYLSLCLFNPDLFYLLVLFLHNWNFIASAESVLLLSLFMPRGLNDRRRCKESLHLCTCQPMSLVVNFPDKSRRSMWAVADSVLTPPFYLPLHLLSF